MHGMIDWVSRRIGNWFDRLMVDMIEIAEFGEDDSNKITRVRMN